MPFFILFVLIPLAEIFVFMKMSEIIGLGLSLLMALGTAILGGYLVRRQGLQTMMNAQNSMNQGQIPSKDLFDGLCIVAAGATLITPGFITDFIGFSLLIPKVRDILREKLKSSARFSVSGFNPDYTEFHDHKHYHKPDDPSIIDVEYETIDEKIDKG